MSDRLTRDQARAAMGLSPEDLRTRRRKPGNPEQRLQREIVADVELIRPDLLLVAIPNGGHRNKAVAANMKAEGVTKGASDLLVIGRGTVLFAEVKLEKGQYRPDQKRTYQSREQREFEEAITALGHPYRVVRSTADLLAAIEEVGL